MLEDVTRPFGFALTVNQPGLAERFESVGKSLGGVLPDGGEKTVFERASENRRTLLTYLDT